MAFVPLDNVENAKLHGCSPETDASSGLTRSLHGCEQRAYPALLQNLQNLKEQTRYPGAWAISLVACFAMISNTLCQMIAQLYTPQNPSVRDGHPCRFALG